MYNKVCTTQIILYFHNFKHCDSPLGTLTANLREIEDFKSNVTTEMTKIEGRLNKTELIQNQLPKEGPKGEKGDPGQQGPKGPKGEKGDPGNLIPSEPICKCIKKSVS